MDVTATSVQAVSNTGYMADNAAQVTITLPAAPTLGDVIQVNGVGAGGWAIASNAGQSIVTTYISATPLAGVISGLQGEAIELQYIGNNQFSVLNYVGANPNTLVFPVGYVSEGGLIWMPVSNPFHTYAQAVPLCAGTINGLSGWRLPTGAELIALYNSGAMNGQGWYLSYTIAASADGGITYGQVWMANPGGYEITMPVAQSAGWVTCVR